MNEVQRGLDTVAAVADKALDEGSGLAKRVLAWSYNQARKVIAAPVAVFVGAVVENKANVLHVVTTTLASWF